jgi:hypothetical protein
MPQNLNKLFSNEESAYTRAEIYRIFCYRKKDKKLSI